MKITVHLLAVGCVVALGGCAGALPALHSGAAAIAAHASAAPVAAAVGAGGVGLGVGVLVSDDLKKLAQEARDTRFGTQTAGTFGAFLQDTQTGAQSMVQAAMRGQRDALVVAGLQAQSALVRAQVAYVGSRNIKLESLAPTENSFKSDMESVMQDLASTSDATVKAAGERARGIATRVKLEADIPQVRSLGPVFLFPFLPNQTITIRGTFPASYPRDGVPELSVNGKSYKAFDYQTDSLRFSVPTANLDAIEPRETVWNSAELVVPWSRSVLNITTSTEFAKFGIVFGVLTQSFGRVELRQTVARIRTEEKTLQSEDFQFSPGGADENRCLRLTEAELSEGWRIRPGSGAVAFDMRGDSGRGYEWKDLGMQNQTDRTVCWKARAVHAEEGIAGDGGHRPKAVWKISAMLVRGISEPSVSEEGVDLAWGGKHTFKLASGPWTLRYVRSGSPPTELSTADASNPLIRVQAEGSNVLVSVYPF